MISNHLLFRPRSVQNKIHDTDPEGTALRIQEYKTSNEESIKRNAQRAVEERRLATWQEQERLRNLNKRRQFYEDLHEKERKAAEAEKIAYLQSLVVKPVEKGKQGNGVPAPVAAVKSKPSNAGPAISFLPDAPFLPDDEPAVIPPWELQKKETEQPIEDRTWRTWQSEAPIYSYDLPPADLGQVRDPLWESMKMDRGWLGGGNRGEFLKERALCAAVEGLFLVPGA